MTTTEFVSRTWFSDLFIHVESPQYCFISDFVWNQAVATVDLDDVIGYPLIFNSSKWKLADAGDEANVVGLIVNGPAISDLLVSVSTPNQYLILKHPPAVLNEDKMVATDHTGAAFTVATIITALKTLLFEFRKQPDFTTTQTSDS